MDYSAYLCTCKTRRTQCPACYLPYRVEWVGANGDADGSVTFKHSRDAEDYFRRQRDAGVPVRLIRADGRVAAEYLG